MEIRSFVADELGNSSHMLLVPEAGLAAAIDPLRDVAQYLEIIETTGLKLAWALETHVHNDFVSGLARTSLRDRRDPRRQRGGWASVPI